MIVSTTPELAGLLAAYRDARDAAKAATDRRDELTAVLKQAMMAQAQAQDPTDPLTDTELIVGELKATLRQQTTMRLDTAKLKAAYPEVYAAFAKQTSSLVLSLGLS